MITFVAGAAARIADIVANPSVAPSGSGGTPKSTTATGIASVLTKSIASWRVPAAYTLWSENAQRNWRKRPASSSTINSGFGFGGMCSNCCRQCHRLPLRDQGQDNAHCGAKSFLRDYFEITSRHANEFTGLKGTDSVAIGLRRAERQEEFVTNERVIHARPMVDDFDKQLSSKSTR